MYAPHPLLIHNHNRNPNRNRHALSHSLSSSRKLRPTTSDTVTFPTLHPRLSLQTNHVSLQETQTPDANPESSSKSYIWVNPNSPRASQLRNKSYDTSFASLVKVAESLVSVGLTQTDVVDILKGLGDRVLEQDAVVVLNNMVNPENSLLVLKYFQQRFKPKREIVLYNVTLKVFRKCRDLERAEKLFEEILERGVKPDNVTFSTMISCSKMSYLPDKAV